MSGFSAEWLALREPADAVARSLALVKFVARPGKCVDLGGGTGSNVRFLAPRLPAPQRWIVVDQDPALLAHVPPNAASLHADLTTVVDDADLFRDCSLVTASALLDLVSERWLRRLVDSCRRAGAAVLFALSYDGRAMCDPREPEDDSVLSLVNQHQKIDKGFGGALGPDAAARAAALLGAAGYEVADERSDWQLGAGDAELQRQLITGWAEAASAVRPQEASAFRDWRDRRVAHVNAGGSRIVVGHVDVAARI